MLIGDLVFQADPASPAGGAVVFVVQQLNSRLAVVWGSIVEGKMAISSSMGLTLVKSLSTSPTAPTMDPHFCPFGRGKVHVLHELLIGLLLLLEVWFLGDILLPLSFWCFGRPCLALRGQTSFLV